MTLQKQISFLFLGLSCLHLPVLAIEANDVSQLSPTQVQSIVSAPGDPQQAELALQGLVKSAALLGDTISVAGASHSMGGHTLYPGGIVLNMLPFNQLQYLPESQTLRVGAGARWSEVIAYLRPLQRSVSVMQSNNAFSVGGSLSVNCHGWQANRPPIASTVRSFRLLMADGQIKTCSRRQNPELFRLALGGYGLFGVILEAELETVPDAVYQGQSYVLPASDYVAAFERHVNQQPGAVMAYGRLRVDSDAFLEQVILNVFVTAAPEATLKRQQFSLTLDPLKHSVFRNSVHHAGGKRLRWELESRLGQFIGQHLFWRSDLLDQPLDVIENEETKSSDILHEYFIPRAQVSAFIENLKTIIPRHQANLLNVTLRNVLPDHDTELAYAREEVFGFVMLFHQHHSQAEEAKMQALTQDLIRAALALNGTYYLPYRLHATQAQFQQAYPQASKVKQRKQIYDPQALFQNSFYQKYLNEVSAFIEQGPEKS